MRILATRNVLLMEDADCINVVDPDSARPYADSDANPDSDFYLMRIRIRLFP